MTALGIVPAQPAHEKGWRMLWDLYCGGEVSPEVTDHTWQRILDPASGIGCIIATVNAEVAGFLTYVEHEGTWETKPLCYIEDLYVAKDHRGRTHDIAYKLIGHLQSLLETGRWSRIYGITRQDNIIAQRLYARFADGKPYMRYIRRSRG